MELNRLSNGRFLHNLDSWTASGAAYSAGDGDDHYGVAVLSTGGDSIAQTFTVPHVRMYTLHASIKPVTEDAESGELTAVITDGDGNTVVTINLTGSADTWTEITSSLGLAHGTTYTLTITNVNVTQDVKIDDVWLWPAPYTRAELVARVAAKLARLATERSLSSAASGALTEGDYTYAVDAALAAVGALNPDTDLPDVRYLDYSLVPSALDMLEREMLEQLRRDYAVEVDISAGPIRESLSQKGAALDKLLSGREGAGAGRIVVRDLEYEANDYEL